jgi:heme exporter protein C
MRNKTVYTLGILGTLLLLYDFYQIFLVIPIDALQGNIFRIIFIHVPAAFTAFCFYGVAVVGSIAFLMTKNFKWDSMAVSAVEVGTMFTLVNLATGSIWGRVEWGIWWAWDARMTSQLMCFLLYLSSAA